jgi:hypothetical protein
MEREKVVFVPCVFLRGAFPHERIFVIRLGDGWEYRGVAPARYCLAPDRKSPAEMPPPNSEVEGLIVGIQISQDKNGLSRIQLPDGEVYELSEEHFKFPSRAEVSNVPVES